MKLIIAIVLILFSLFLIGCTKTQQTPEANECTTSEDCVAATCCHASKCVPKDQAPDCSGVFCSMSCEPGTMDCGGSCGCVEGKCTANIVS